MSFLSGAEKFGSGTGSATLAGMHRGDTLPWPVLSLWFSNLMRRRIQKNFVSSLQGIQITFLENFLSQYVVLFSVNFGVKFDKKMLIRILC